MSDNPLIGLFSSRSLVRLLSIFLLNPDRSYYQQELVQLTGGTLRPIQLALERLTLADLVSKRRHGKQVYYQTVATHPAYPDLRALFEKTFAVADIVREALEPLLPGLRFAFIHGSTAKAELRATSDIDLFLVGGIGRRQVAGALSGIDEHLGREVNVSLYTPKRLREMLDEGDPFVLNVIDGPRIWLVGDEDGLGRLGG